MVDVDTIGAGGGSIAYVDAGGIFRVGPRSAGADPGPAPTTAAARSRPRRTRWSTSAGCCPRLFLGGEHGAARGPRAQGVRRGPGRAARHVHRGGVDGRLQILSHSMVQSIEENSVRKGFDPRDFALVAEGGARPALRARRSRPRSARQHVLVPPLPGHHRGARPAGHRHGLRVRRDDRTRWLVDSRRRRRSRRSSRSSRSRRARSSRTDGIDRRPGASSSASPTARYVGQGYELRVDVGAGAIDDAWVEQVQRRLPRHPRARVLAPLRGRRHPDRRTSASAASGSCRSSRRRRSRAGDASPDGALSHERDAWFRDRRRAEEGRDGVLRAHGAEAGNVIEGPAIVNQFDSTTVDPARLRRPRSTAFGNIVIGSTVRPRPSSGRRGSRDAARERVSMAVVA